MLGLKGTFAVSDAEIKTAERKGELLGVIKTAKGMLSIGVDIEKIIAVTGLNKEDIID